MNLEEKINNDIKTSMLAKEKEKLNALRAIKSEILLLKTDKNAGAITEELEIKTLQRLIKQRKEAAETYKNQHRNDLYEEEMFQVNVISAYLPTQLSEEDVTQIIKQIIAKENITDIKGMGKIMGLAAKTLAGKAENKLISDIVKKLLQ
ncbi:MAG: GatB/YqeY domain-containing protein [Bacteroidales bacterium]|nr:GatB/YqeY domain-containing protein [Bacteroidales bacterium]